MRFEEQSIQWQVVGYIKDNYPDVLFTCAPGNAKSVRQGVINKKMGYCKGWPDLFIAYPVGGYHGLFIELKTSAGKDPTYQKELRNKLSVLGYKTALVRSEEEAILLIDRYIRGKNEKANDQD